MAEALEKEIQESLDEIRVLADRAASARRVLVEIRAHPVDDNWKEAEGWHERDLVEAMQRREYLIGWVAWQRQRIANTREREGMVLNRK